MKGTNFCDSAENVIKLPHCICSTSLLRNMQNGQLSVYDGVSTVRVRHAPESPRPEPREGHAEAVKRRLAGGMLAEPSQRRGVAMRDRLLARGVSTARVRRAPDLQRPETRLGHAAAGVQAEHDGVRRNGFGQCWSGHAPSGTLCKAHPPRTFWTIAYKF